MNAERGSILHDSAHHYTVDPMICQFRVCELAHLLKPVCNLQINTHILFIDSHEYAQNGKNVSHLILMFPAEVEHGDVFAFLFQLLYYK